jgi:3-methyladenine DNA glycosylase/8-oxoguanine DNA glycosylase
MHSRAIDHLRRADPRFAPWIERHGLIRLPARRSPEPLLALLETIVYQQLAGAAAKAIWTRVAALFPDGPIDPAALLAMPDEALGNAGLSRSKALAMKSVAAAAAAGALPDAAGIRRMTEAQIIAALTPIRGVGPWTVHMLLIFTLRRPDILPVGDYGIRKGFQLLCRHRTLPTPRQLTLAAERWRPYRTAACLYLWRIASAPRPRKGHATS